MWTPLPTVNMCQIKHILTCVVSDAKRSFHIYAFYLHRVSFKHYRWRIFFFVFSNINWNFVVVLWIYSLSHWIHACQIDKNTENAFFVYISKIHIHNEVSSGNTSSISNSKWYKQDFSLQTRNFRICICRVN